MRVIADSKGRITARDVFRPGAAFDLQSAPDGAYRIVELVEKKTPRAKLVRRNGRTFLESGKTFTNTDVQKALEDFP